MKILDDKGKYSWQIESEEYFKYGRYAKYWFEYMEWLIILGGLDYLSAMVDNLYLSIISFVSWFFIYNFIQQHLWTIKYQVLLPKFIEGKLRQFLTYLFAALVVAASYTVVDNVVGELVKLNT